MTALGASLLEGLLAADPGHRGPRIACGAGHVAEFISYRAKAIDTVLGPIRLQRAYYHCRECRAGVVPRDAELDLCRESLSGGLRAMIAATGAAVPFAQAATLIKDLAGITLSTKRVERAAEAVGPPQPPPWTRIPSRYWLARWCPCRHQCQHRRFCTSPWMGPGCR